ncbi:glutamic acid-rich protein-like [Neocloeon triangulifer]|uniref:glutamic acid-rich protein-like n=1 Tax=Neocloeon triangulifer TaxID=2078957 RepID=UPI00286F4667|nr:glutamic acid-rich protein-like [Neocloeon triangulifer]
MAKYSCFLCNKRSCKKDERSLHKFPNKEKNSEQHKGWLLKLDIKEEDFDGNIHAFLCSEHFEASEFEIGPEMRKRLMPDSYGNSKRQLKENAIPTLKLPQKQLKKKPAPALEVSKQCTSKLDKSAGRKRVLSSYSEPPPLRPCARGSRGEQEQNNECSDTQDDASEANEDDESYAADHDDEHDETFGPPDDEGSSSEDSEFDEDEDNEMTFGGKSSVFFVQKECLLQLFKFCQQCGAPVENTEVLEVGTLVTVKTTCLEGHFNEWKNQKVIESQPLLNVEVSSAVFLSGINFEAYQRLCTALNLSNIHKSTYFRKLRANVLPVIEMTGNHFARGRAI